MSPSRRDFLRTGICLALGLAGPAGLSADMRDAADGQSSGRPLRGDRAFGTAVTPSRLAAAETERAIDTYCRFVVPEYHGQWSAVEWRRGEPWFGDLDAIVNYARERDKAVRGHALLWDRMTPGWARDAMASEGWAVVHRHFADLLGRYDHRDVPEWIVVNECVETEHGDAGYRLTGAQHAFGNDYIRRAYATARELAPKTRLFLNEFSLEYDNPVDRRRRRALLRLAEDLRRDGLIDGIGIQGHLELSKGRLAEREFASMLEVLAGMGLEIAITELDVLEHDRHAGVETRDRRVADATKAFLALAAAQPAVRSIATWGLSDGESWLQDRQPETRLASRLVPPDQVALNRGLPFACDQQPKPMWTALRANLTA